MSWLLWSGAIILWLLIGAFVYGLALGVWEWAEEREKPLNLPSNLDGWMKREIDELKPKHVVLAGTLILAWPIIPLFMLAAGFSFISLIVSWAVVRRSARLAHGLDKLRGGK